MRRPDTALPVCCASGLLLSAAPAFAAGVSFVSPSSGQAAVSSPVHLEFAVQGLTVRPAGRRQPGNTNNTGVQLYRLLNVHENTRAVPQTVLA